MNASIARENAGRSRRERSVASASSFDRCNQSPFSILDPNLVPLQYLRECLAYLGTAGSLPNRSKVNLREVAVGSLSELYTHKIQNILHVHRTVSFLWDANKEMT